MTAPPNPEVAILNAALELCPEERSAYLDKACAGDVDLRRRVEGLLQAHEQAGSLYANHGEWARRAILNIAASGRFSSDRTIGEYAADIWKVESCPAT